MKWYFAMSEASIDRDGHDWSGLIRVAVSSAKRNTELKPHLLYDGEPSSLTRELEAEGVKIIPRRISFYDAIDAKYGSSNPWHVKIAAGAFLRVEIPEVEFDDEVVLYTDCDVHFLRKIELGDVKPTFFSATSQTDMTRYDDLNSGVMLINVRSMRAELPSFKEFIVNNLSLGLDQEMLAVFFKDRYEVLDPAYNWKPYWGVNQEARIIHWHGPKPVIARSKAIDPTYATGVQVWEDLMSRDMSSYVYYTGLWDQERRCGGASGSESAAV